jgi:hypothetical protein
MKNQNLIGLKVKHRRADNGVGVIKKLITDYDGGFTQGKHAHGAWVEWPDCITWMEAPLGDLQNEYEGN